MEPDPAEAAALAESVERLLGKLDPALRVIAVWKMEGDSNRDIAEKLAISVETVYRKLKLIRAVWDEGDVPEP